MTPSRSFWTRIDRPFVFGFLVTLGALGAIVLGLAVANLSTVLIYIALAMFAALGLDPTVRFLERRGLSRAISVVVAILGLIVVAGLVVWMVLPVVIDQIASFVGSVPGMIQEFTRSDLYAALDEQFGDQFQDLVADVQSFLTNPGNIAAIGGGALKVGASIANAISGIIVVLVLTLYFVATLPAIKTGMLRLSPARDRARASDITDQITDSVGAYVMGMVVLAFCNAVLAFLLYLFLGLPFPPLMATVAFCITLIPLVGSVIFWIIGTGLALFTNPIAALVFALIYLVYMQIEAYVITPPRDEPRRLGARRARGDRRTRGRHAAGSARSARGGAGRGIHPHHHQTGADPTAGCPDLEPGSSSQLRARTRYHTATPRHREPRMWPPSRARVSRRNRGLTAPHTQKCPAP